MAGWTRVLPALLMVTLLVGCEAIEAEIGARPPAPAATAVPASRSPASVPAAATPSLAPSRPSPSATRSVTPTPTATATATPTATPISSTPTAARPAASGYRSYTSALYPYAIDYLETWRAVGGGATFDNVKADLFAGDKTGDITNTVTIFTQTLAAGTNSEFFLDASLADLAEAGIKPADENRRTIAGTEAYVFSYTAASNNQTYAVTQAVFVRGNQGWIVTLTAAPDDQARLMPVFTHMLDSFQAWN